MPAEENHRNGSGDPFAIGNRRLQKINPPRPPRSGPARPGSRDHHRDSLPSVEVELKPGGGDRPGPGRPGPIARELEAPLIWQSVLERLAQQFPPEIMEEFLHPVKAVSCADRAFVIETPDAFTTAWLERRMYSAIVQTLASLAEMDFDLVFVTGQPPAPIDPDRCEGYPCEKDHDTQTHRDNILAYIRELWGVDDAANLARPELWTFEIMEDTLRSLGHFTQKEIKALPRPSGYFCLAIRTVARAWGMTDQQIAERIRRSTFPYLMRKRAQEGLED